MKKSHFMRGMMLLTNAFNCEFNEDLYWSMLKDIDDAKWEKVVKELVITKTEIYPKTNLIAIIRERAYIDEDEYPTEGEAYRQACNYIAKHYYEAAPDNFKIPDFEWSHRLIEQTLRLIGHKEFANSREGDPAIRAHFMQIYRSLITQDKRYKMKNEQKSIPWINKDMIE